jgi:hypothetical protein
LFLYASSLSFIAGLFLPIVFETFDRGYGWQSASASLWRISPLFSFCVALSIASAVHFALHRPSDELCGPFLLAGATLSLACLVAFGYTLRYSLGHGGLFGFDYGLIAFVAAGAMLVLAGLAAREPERPIRVQLSLRSVIGLVVFFAIAACAIRLASAAVQSGFVGGWSL